MSRRGWFNRTFMELKFVVVVIAAYLIDWFNRTFMELKCISSSLATK